ncbi:unnamed protein product [Bursaphelenchus okinawaensis]|uniref:Uncharacterized protein n=1 Tax=Bursaphelenchus okinawaensis TaxID=465554 RepID=A0A811L5S2_9BILA|nr:unnamed protein product [Bursaphelenchus okinawaensis]CAG9119964.1 unnamed protein product [Bursaphelenchus okinawaensis]
MKVVIMTLLSLTCFTLYSAATPQRLRYPFRSYEDKTQTPKRLNHLPMTYPTMMSNQQGRSSMVPRSRGMKLISSPKDKGYVFTWSPQKNEGNYFLL